ncbi:MAG TPA: YciI family protein [Terriglobia bacterium]|nr:YciI family protein [Terriglobia bacterium]
MRYMLLVYSNENSMEAASPEERAAIRAGHAAVIGETSQRGILRGAEPLEPTRTATTVRVQQGKALLTDGPFAETKEQLAGYYILDCKDLDEALEWAARIPTACAGGSGCIEVRPIRLMPQASA